MMMQAFKGFAGGGKKSEVRACTIDTLCSIILRYPSRDSTAVEVCDAVKLVARAATAAAAAAGRVLPLVVLLPSFSSC